MRRRWMLAVLVIATALITSYALARSGSPPKAYGRVDRYRLTGTGIGNIRFGQAPEVVAARLERLFGRPSSASAASSIGYFQSVGCGLDHEIVWAGLAVKPDDGNSSGLTLYFERSRFVGYSYGPPYGGPRAPAVRDGPMLATSMRLGLGAALARGRRLYGRRFAVTSQAQGTPVNPQLVRLPLWEVHTTRGRIYGFIDSPDGPLSTHQRTIGSISAGVIPNTPCR